MPEFLINGKDAVAVMAAQKLEGHGGGTLLAVLYTTSRAEAAFAAERNELPVPTVGASIQGSTEGRVATVDHLFDVLQFNSSGMEGILNYFIVVFKNHL